MFIRFQGQAKSLQTFGDMIITEISMKVVGVHLLTERLSEAEGNWSGRRTSSEGDERYADCTG